MRTALLDVNVLIALAWPSHIHHEVAHQWFHTEQQYGWATCPITQSALVRLSSNAKILPDAVTPSEALALLQTLTKLPHHQFWKDELPLTESVVFQNGYVVGHRQITDAYLYSLAIHRDARLVTFDAGIQTLHPSAGDRHLLVLKS